MHARERTAIAVVVVLLSLVALARVGRSTSASTAAPPPPAAEAPAIVEVTPDAGPPESLAARALREGRPMDLNAATAEDLELLPRIGPALASRIVSYREAHGPFERVDDLRRVRGIGPRTIEGLRHLVTVSQ